MLYRGQMQAAYAKVRHKKFARRPYRAMFRAAFVYRGLVLDWPDRQVMVWSDLHLGHERVIEYAERPFLDADDMDSELWGAWADEVGRDDVVVCVGDLAMGPARNEATWTRLRNAPGKQKILVVGNHDVVWRDPDPRDLGGRGEVQFYPRGFDEMCTVLVSGCNPPLVWTHYPLDDVPEGCVNVHGHAHQHMRKGSPHINVSVEQLDYRPVALTRIRSLARALVAGESPPGATTLERIEATEAGQA